MMNRGKKLFRGSALNSIALVLEIAIAFFMMPFLIHSLGDRMYGIWLLVVAFLGYFNLSRMGFASAVSRYLSRAVGKEDDSELSIIISTSFFVNLVFSAIMVMLTIVLIVVAGYVVKDPENLRLFQILVLILGFNTASRPPLSIFGAMLRANLQLDILGVLGIVTLLIRNALIFIFVFNGYGLVSMALVSVIGNLIHSGVVIFYENRLFGKINIRWRNFRKDKVKELFNYSIFNFIGQIAQTLNMKIDLFVITAFVGLAAVTHYNIGFRLVQYFTLMIGAVIGSCSTYFSQQEGKGDYDSIRKNFLFVTKILIYISIFIGTAIIFYGKAFILRWMGTEYIDSYAILVILAIPYMFSACQRAVGAVLRGISKHQFIAYTGLAIGVINVVLSLILVRHYGIIGVALGTAIPVFFLRPVALGIYITKVLKINRWEYLRFICGHIMKALVSLGVFYIFVNKLLTPNYLVLLSIALIGGIYYLGLSYYLFFNKQEKTRILGLMR